MKNLQNRLEKKDLENDPSKIKWKQPKVSMTIGEAWQQWIRLVDSYSDGLFAAYDDENLDFTNNTKEQLFGRSKYHFRALLGK